MDYKKINDYEAIYMVRENGEEARDIILDKYMPVIRKIANKYYNQYKDNGADYEDFIQEGLIALNKAIDTYDEDNKALFYSFAVMCITRHMISYCRNITCKKNTVLNNSIRKEELIYNYRDIQELEQVFDNKYIEEKFVEMKNSLEFLDSNIFELKFNGFGYKEIGKLLDVPVNIIDYKLSKIRKKLQLELKKDS